MIWLFNPVDQTWHIWDHVPVNDDHAWCGLPKTDACVVNGDPEVTTKCQTCYENLRTLPSPP